MPMIFGHCSETFRQNMFNCVHVDFVSRGVEGCGSWVEGCGGRRGRGGHIGML